MNKIGTAIFFRAHLTQDTNEKIIWNLSIATTIVRSVLILTRKL